jgi:hypothetical protein
MDVPNLRDWFNVGAIVPLLAVLFSSAFGLFEAATMSPQAEFLWIIGIIVIAFLVWFNAAKTQQRERESRERERAVMIRLDELKQLLAKPGTTLEDVKRAIGVDARLSAASSMRVQVEAIKPTKNG